MPHIGIGIGIPNTRRRLGFSPLAYGNRVAWWDLSDSGNVTLTGDLSKVITLTDKFGNG